MWGNLQPDTSTRGEAKKGEGKKRVCALCGQNTILHTHHWKYISTTYGYRQKNHWCIKLCPDCHSYIHRGMTATQQGMNAIKEGWASQLNHSSGWRNDAIYLLAYRFMTVRPNVARQHMKNKATFSRFLQHRFHLPLSYSRISSILRERAFYDEFPSLWHAQ